MGTQTLAQRSLLLFTQTDKVHQKNCIRCSHWSSGTEEFSLELQYIAIEESAYIRDKIGQNFVLSMLCLKKYTTAGASGADYYFVARSF